MSEPSGGIVDLDKARKAINETKEHYQKNPASGKVTLRATARLVKDALIEGRIGHFKFTADEPPQRGGNDTAPSPLEHFLIGAAF